MNLPESCSKDILNLKTGFMCDSLTRFILAGNLKESSTSYASLVNATVRTAYSIKNSQTRPTRSVFTTRLQ